MVFRTVVDIESASFLIPPCERMLFVGSCFADSIGKRFQEEMFNAVVNPYGVMYNPASILHSVDRFLDECKQIPNVVFLTLGTNHVYVLKETGEIVDNCRKRPHRLFQEQELSVDECEDFLAQAVSKLLDRNGSIKVVVTVSPIRYAKYGFHGSALSKATLLLAANRLQQHFPDVVSYFPAYEIINDELRDYRFYQPDMIHPSEQAVEYIWLRFADVYLDQRAKKFLEQWKPIKEALGHRPFNPESEEYKAFIQDTIQKANALAEQYPDMPPIGR
ncbi:MAG: GSCFA domain-containing protein [Prevotella sp.]|nr:GSCFA domain-containing protein [Prevotella sp.]